MVNSFLAADGIRPEQFGDIWHRTVERSGEQMLMLAMVEQAAEDLDHYRTARHSEDKRIFDQTYRWIAANDPTWPYSFTSICETLDLPRAAIRARLLIEDGASNPQIRKRVADGVHDLNESRVGFFKTSDR